MEAPGVLSNDSDGDTDPLTAVLVTGVSHGTLTLNANGGFTYTPDANFTGADSFTYKATDGSADSSSVTVTITVNPVNDAPVAVADSYSTDEDTVLTMTAPGVLSNDSDSDSDPMTAVLVTGVSHGTLTLNANGGFTYTPDANFNGADSFTYKANDGLADSSSVTVTITVNAVNDAPVAVADSYSTNEDTLLSVPAPGVLSNDSDVDSATITAVLVSDVTSGTLTLNANGGFTYTPDANFNGADSFTYKATDGSADSSSVTVTITVTEYNMPPVAVADSYSTNEDTVLTVVAPGVLSNDSDGDSDPMTAVLVTGVSHGTLTLNANGGFTYEPAANFDGTDTFTYKANDGAADSSSVTVTITVNPVNDAPVAVADSYSTDEDTVLTVDPGVLSNDSDGDTDPMTAVLVTGVSHGTLTLNANGGFMYTPDANFNGTDTFTYKANDGSADSNTVTVMITVNQVNDAPDAVADSYSTDEDTVLTVIAPGVLANDSDSDSATITAVLVSDVTSGSLTLNANGGFTYTPDANFNGADSFTYKATDGLADSSSVTVTITVNPVNDAPDAVDDTAITNDETSVVINVLANDIDPDSDTLTVIAVSIPAHGTAVINADYSVTYTPAVSYSGADSFTYTISDGNGETDTATVSVNVVGDLGDAVEAPTLVWTTGGSANWFPETTQSYYDGDAAQSGAIGNSQSTYLQTTVTGPGTLTFWWKVSSQTRDYLRFYVDGTLQASIQGEVAWQQKTYSIAEGTHTLKWEYVKDRATVAGSDCGWVDWVVFTPAGDTTPPGPVTGLANTTYEQTSITWTWTDPIDADLDYVNVFLDGAPVGIVQDGVQTYTATGLTPATAYTLGVTTVDTSGNENIATVTDSATTAPTLDTTPPGPVTGLVNTTYEQTAITWTWTDPIDADLNYVNVFLDGAPVGIVQDGVQTYTATGLTPATAYTLGITTIDTSGNENTATVTDSATTAPSSGTPTLGDAVDNTGLAWTTGGNANWFPETTQSYYDGDAAQSGAIGNSQSTYLQTTVTGPGTLTFWWKVSSQTRDYLRFYIDGTLQASIQGEVAWQQKTYSIPEGTHTLKWEYVKDRLASAGSDCGWVDWVVFTPAGDTTPPGPVTGLANTTYEQTSITWTWTDPIDADLDYVNVFLDGAPVGIVQNGIQTYTATGLTPAMSYTLGVTTVDTSGNENIATVTDSATTAPTLDTTPPGPVTGLANTTFEQTSITWTWTDPIDADLDYVNVFLDGAPVGIVQDGVQTYTATGLTPATAYTLGVTTVDTSGNENTATVTDSATTAPSSGTPTLGDAVDNTGLVWTTGGSASWFPETTQSYYDGDAAQSGAIGNSQSTYLQTTVTGPGTLTFWWKVSSQTRDPLTFSIDGMSRASVKGEVAWQEKTYSITEGTHVLKWEYVKDRAYSAGSDAGWVDKVTFSSPSTPLYTEVTRSSHTALPLQIIRSSVTRSHGSGQFPA